MTPTELDQKSQEINARRAAECFAQHIKGHTDYEPPANPPTEMSPDLDDMECLRLLTTAEDQLSCPASVGNYVNRLKTRAPENLTDMQRLVIWADGALRAGERLITLVSIRDKQLLFAKQTAVKQQQRITKLENELKPCTE